MPKYRQKDLKWTKTWTALWYFHWFPVSRTLPRSEHSPSRQRRTRRILHQLASHKRYLLLFRRWSEAGNFWSFHLKERKPFRTRGLDNSDVSCHFVLVVCDTNRSVLLTTPNKSVIKVNELIIHTFTSVF